MVAIHAVHLQFRQNSQDAEDYAEYGRWFVGSRLVAGRNCAFSGVIEDLTTMRGKCSRCKELLTSENASPAVVRSGYGRCRSCERKHAKVQQRTLGGRFTQGKTQAKFNGHKWSLSFQQYTAIVASGECFYCGKPLPTAAGGLDREENVDYTWDAVLPCCGKQPRAKGPRGCNETKSGEMAPIVLFAIRWHEKYGKLPTEQDFRDRLRKFKAERDRMYAIISSLDSERLKKLRRATSVRECLASLTGQN